MPLEGVQQACELLALVEPKAHLGALLVLEALAKLVHKGVKDHRASNHLRDAQHTSLLQGLDVDLDAVVEVGVPAVGPLL